MRSLTRAALVFRLSLLGVLLVGLVLGVLGIRWVVESRMAEVRSSILLFLQEKLGRNISFGRLSPSVFGQLDITDLKVYARDDPDRVILHVSRVRVRYGFLKLILTRRPLEALKEINLSDSLLSLDWSADHELLDLVRELAGGETAPPAFGPAGLRVTGTDLTVRLVSQKADIGISQLAFALTGGGPSLAISLRCGLVLDLDLPGPLGGHLETLVDMGGSATHDLKRADLTVQVRSLVHDRLALRDQTFLLAYRDGVITATKIEDRAPLDLELRIDIPESTARIAFRTDELELRDLVSLRGEWAAASDWLTNAVTTRGTVGMSLDGSNLVYELDIGTVVSHPSLPDPVTVSAALRGDAGRLEVHSLTARSPEGELQWSGDLELPGFLPAGELSVSGFASLIGRPIAGTLSIERVRDGPRTVGVRSPAVSVGTLTVRDLAGVVALDTDHAQVRIEARLPPASDAHTGLVRLTGSVRWAPTLSADLDGVFSGVKIGPVMAGVATGGDRALPPALAPYSVSSHVTLAVAPDAYSLHMTDLDVVDPGNAGSRLQGSVFASNDVLDIRDVRATYQGQRVLGGARVGLEDGRAVGFESAFSLNGVPFEVEGALDQNDLRFTGSYGIEGALVIFPFETNKQDLYFWVTSGPVPIPMEGLEATASLNLKGVFPDGDDWFLTSDGSQATLVLPPVNGNATPTAVDAELDFILDRAGVTFDRIVLADSVSGVAGAGTLVFRDLAAGSVGLDVTLGGESGEERYSVSGSITPDGLDLQLDVSGSPVAHLGQTELSGTLRGSARITGVPTALRVQDGRVALDYGRLNAEPLVLDTGLAISPNRLDLMGLRLTLGNHTFTQGNAAVDLDTGAFSADVRYAAELLRDQVRTRMVLTGKAPGYGIREISALAFPDSLEALLTVSEATVDGVPFPGWDVRFRTQGDAVVFDGGPPVLPDTVRATAPVERRRGVLDGSLTRDGRLTVNLREPFPLVATLGGVLNAGGLALDVAVKSFDLRALSSLIDTDVVKFTGGTASTPGQGTIRIQGPINDPDFVGSLRVVGGRVTSPLSPDTAMPVDTWLHFGPSGSLSTDPNASEKAFVLDEVTAPMGKGTITAVAQFVLDHWAPTAFTLRLTAEPPSGVHVVWRFGTLAVDGYATGSVLILYDGLGARVTSENLAIQNARLNMDYTGVEDAPPEDVEPFPLDVDLRIHTARGVQFLWPAQLFPILKATARQGSEVRLLWDGEANELVMIGDVGVLGGSAFFFDRSFSIREGSISFRENALQFDPRVSLRAEIRERDADNREFRIYLDADRVRLSELSTETIRFSSDPPQPSAAILARLGQSIFRRTQTAGLDSPDDPGTGALPLIASLTGDVISQLGILSPAEDWVRETLGLDLVSLRTQIVQNFLVDKALGGALDNSSPTLGKYFGNTELTVGKYIGDDVFLEMMVRLETAVAQPGLLGMAGLRGAFEISLEWDTPFFTLDWSLVPQHLEDLFLTDNTLGLRWRYRY